ncbi:DNA polymerase III subunit chi [Amorphus orientalis]|uniref:DNA polymerase-3 subunit chi n=1 Tax=Amorphus orientalis TaxID=649198 RepID=A0AAE4AT24_9HYPH|nr:DNA polymerase III subunit chi [Amorphus orientalis]MDQ0315630.1 DNA polymerase-3 subunit chi [Amorphus orientalis]
MTEVLFYHLERQPLDQVLPTLLERSLARGWRVVVQSSDPERRDALDAHLWTYRDDAFLPHGTAHDGHASLQPIWLTAVDENPNQANVRFLVDRATTDDLSAYERVVYLFDGHDPESVQDARSRWSEAKAAGHSVTYWRQSASGAWEKKAG